jgi:beta-lactam-binding protein with PASTA domain
VIAAAVAGFYAYQQIQDQLNQNTPIAVNNYVPLRADLAVRQIKADGFRPRVIKKANSTVPAGHVYDQNPAAGDRQDKGSTITIFVSTGKPKVKVPDVTGMQLTQAVAALGDAGLRANPVPVPSDRPAGEVTAQSPTPGDRVVVKTTVRINVSKGPKLVFVPNEISQPYENAASALQGAGFFVLRRDVDSDQPKGIVVNQSPEPGGQVPVGSKVTLEVSKGPKTVLVPDVTGLDEDQARSALEDAGFKVKVKETEVFDATQNGIVVDQNPPANGNAKPGSKVVITVGRFTEQTTTAPTTTTTPTPTP